MPRRKQQLGGLLIALIGGGFTAWGWRAALIEGYYYPKASLLFPAFCVIGLGLTLFPGYKEERIARGEDISQMSGHELITARWWAILAVALVVGIGNYLFITGVMQGE
jgi:ABC-type Fe3+-siderophore transport system permease subunit